MRVFVAGATGALGTPLVRELVDAGHEVVGMTRQRSNVARLEAAGAAGVVGDALDADDLLVQVKEAAPEVIVNALTALPAAGPRTLRDLRATDRLRRDATRNLITAATAAGARRMVGESMILIYGDCGDRIATETEATATPDSLTRLPRRVAGGMADSLAALGALESQILDASAPSPLEGLVLRYGLFYGPGTSSDAWARDLRRRRLALPRSPRSSVSWIHVDDAASATVSTIEKAPAGAVYNVVDDEPAGIPAFADELARVVGAPPAWSVPRRLALLVAPYAASFAEARIAANNDRIRDDLGWRPRYPSYRDGLRADGTSKPGDGAGQ